MCVHVKQNKAEATGVHVCDDDMLNCRESTCSPGCVMLTVDMWTDGSCTLNTDGDSPSYPDMDKWRSAAFWRSFDPQIIDMILISPH